MSFIIRRIAEKERSSWRRRMMCPARSWSDFLRNLSAITTMLKELARRGYSERFIEFLVSYGRQRQGRSTRQGVHGAFLKS